MADALITSIIIRQQLWFIKGASILLTCLSGRRHPWMAKSKRLWNARAITWSTGLTATSLTGRYPTSVLATCRISSEVSESKLRLTDGSQEFRRRRINYGAFLRSITGLENIMFDFLQ